MIVHANVNFGMKAIKFQASGGLSRMFVWVRMPNKHIGRVSTLIEKKMDESN